MSYYLNKDGSKCPPHCLLHEGEPLMNDNDKVTYENPSIYRFGDDHHVYAERGVRYRANNAGNAYPDTEWDMTVTFTRKWKVKVGDRVRTKFGYYAYDDTYLKVLALNEDQAWTRLVVPRDESREGYHTYKVSELVKYDGR